MYVDGQFMINALEFLSPVSIEGIEVYVGEKIPIEYAGANGCGVILVWTKR